MNTREHAVSLAVRGLKVFRVRFGTKGGDGNFVDTDWKNQATDDASAVFSKWSNEAGEPLDFNIGVLAGDDLVLLDVDSPSHGAHKADGFASLETLGPLPPTLTVATPNGGKHLYFKAGGQRFGQSRIKDTTGIDVRNGNGYVIGPGSVVNGRPYVIEADAEPAELPAALAARLRERQEKSADAGQVLGDLDTPANVHAAREYLKAAAVAIEGLGGNEHTYKTFCRVLALGVSPDMAVEIADEPDGWNSRCVPPWEREDLERLAGNATRYRQDAVGVDAPSLGFAPIVQPPIWEAPLAADDFEGRVRTYSATVESDRAIPRRPWIVPGRLIRGAVTVVGGYGSVGKSIWSLQIAAAVALGGTSAAALGFETREPCEVLVVNNEDPNEELDARIAAIADHFALDRGALRGRVHLYSGNGHKFRIAQKGGKGGATTDGLMFDNMRKFVKKRGIGAIILDPLVSLHTGMSENDNADMQSVMDRLTGLAIETRTSVCVLHHTTKPPQASSDSYAGNVNALRGASAVKDAARIALTMFGMNQKDGDRLGIPENIRHRYVRVDDAKANLHLASGEPEWFYKETVRIPNGEDMMALKPIKLAEQPKPVKAATAPAVGGEEAVILDVIDRSFTASEIVASNAIEKLMADPLFKGRSRGSVSKAMRRAVETAGSAWVGEWKGETGGTLKRKAQN